MLFWGEKEKRYGKRCEFLTEFLHAVQQRRLLDRRTLEPTEVETVPRSLRTTYESFFVTLTWCYDTLIHTTDYGSSSLLPHHLSQHPGW